MQKDAHFRINQAETVHEVFDHEVVAINLETGTYYSMPGLGAEVWAWIIKGIPLGTIGHTLSQICDGDPATIEAELDGFVAKLTAHRLIIPNNGAPAAAEPAVSRRQEKTSPSLVLDVFTEMQDLLLLDPIHNVEETGWPRGKLGTESNS